MTCVSEMICLSYLLDFKIFYGLETGEVYLSSRLFLVFFQLEASLKKMWIHQVKDKGSLRRFFDLCSLSKKESVNVVLPRENICFFDPRQRCQKDVVPEFIL